MECDQQEMTMEQENELNIVIDTLNREKRSGISN